MYFQRCKTLKIHHFWLCERVVARQAPKCLPGGPPGRVPGPSRAPQIGVHRSIFRTRAAPVRAECFHFRVRALPGPLPDPSGPPLPAPGSLQGGTGGSRIFFSFLRKAPEPQNLAPAYTGTRFRAKILLPCRRQHNFDPKSCSHVGGSFIFKNFQALGSVGGGLKNVYIYIYIRFSSFLVQIRVSAILDRF